MLVAADGTHSALATACGVDWQQEPCEQLAVIANVATSVAHEGRAFERFTNMARWRCCRCLTDAVRWSGVIHWNGAKSCCRGVTRSFAVNSRSAFGWRLGRITHAGQRSAYPLALTRAARAITHRTVLVGDAAQTLHPIAGQAFNLGMRDVMSLAETRDRRMSAEKTSVITAYCAAINSVDRAIAKQPLARHGTALYIGEPFGTAGCRAQHRD
ncbi:FAD-dependent monooxygenase [Escherichia coli]